MDRNTPSYDDVCRHVGQLFLESRHQIDHLSKTARQTIDELRERLSRAETERDGALSLLRERNDGSTS